MENKNNFNLSNAVALWRQELLAQGEILVGEIRELESHLHSSIDGLKQRGLGEEEAFWLARRRLGPAETIALEFTKAKPYRLWQSRLHWLTAGVLGAYAWTTGLSLLSNGLALHGGASGGRWLVEVVVFAILTGGMVWLAATRARAWSRRFGRIFSSPWRLALGWLLLAAVCVGIGGKTAQLFCQSTLYTNAVGKGVMTGHAAAVWYTSLDTAAAAGLMVLATLGLDWRWRRLAARQANE
jgi:hypothetical protein